jgi:hypothetical protein
MINDTEGKMKSLFKKHILTRPYLCLGTFKKNRKEIQQREHIQENTKEERETLNFQEEGGGKNLEKDLDEAKYAPDIRGKNMV